jgi:hypothetical protein
MSYITESKCITLKDSKVKIVKTTLKIIDIQIIPYHLYFFKNAYKNMDVSLQKNNSAIISGG